jgi:hypothetical protein
MFKTLESIIEALFRWLRSATQSHTKPNMYLLLQLGSQTSRFNYSRCFALNLGFLSHKPSSSDVERNSPMQLHSGFEDLKFEITQKCFFDIEIDDNKMGRIAYDSNSLYPAVTIPLCDAKIEGRLLGLGRHMLCCRGRHNMGSNEVFGLYGDTMPRTVWISWMGWMGDRNLACWTAKHYTFLDSFSNSLV